MRILYGVVGEGMGHATRSKVVCEHLVALGHDVKIVVSGRAHSFLAKSFSDVVEIAGFKIKYSRGAMDRDRSLAHNLATAPWMLAQNVSAYFDKVVDFAPDVVFSDFDSFAYIFAKRHRLPIVSIDNQHIVSRCKHEKSIKRGAKVDYQLLKTFVKAKLPGCDHYIVTTFFFPPVRRKYEDSTTLVPPILRKPILDAKKRAKRGDHVLVYQTQTSDDTLLPALNSIRNRSFVVYGLRKNAVVGNCIVKDFDERGFVSDLAHASAVVSNGGLSLLGEAVYLGKPVYTVPVRHQFEQILNARYIEALGYGVSAEDFAADRLKAFLHDCDTYAERVAEHHQHGNGLLLDTVDRLLDGFARQR